MNTTRLEAFSDGVIAIIITIMVFWLSLLPFATGWMGENHFEPLPSAVYGGILLMAALGYRLLQRTIIVSQGRASRLAMAVGQDWKGRLPLPMYLAAIVAAFWQPAVAQLLCVAVALMWLVPDRRLETVVLESPP